jgi:outer membrane lipoprotein-sorting protein
MIKKNTFISAAISILLMQLYPTTVSRADSPQVVSSNAATEQLNGLQIMTKASERDRGNDHILTSSWTRTRKGRAQFKAKYEEKRKNYRGKDNFDFKTVIRYSEPPTIYRRSILTWAYTNGKRDYWYFMVGFLDARRTNTLTRVRSQAEADFNLTDYVEIAPVTEEHQFRGTEMHDDTQCLVVESTPRDKEVIYGKRVSYIDPKNWIPLKIGYFDRKGDLWKVLTITWQNVSGIWFWRKGVVKNVQEDYTTYIVMEDVKPNTGLNEREFTKVGLERSMN